MDYGFNKFTYMEFTVDYVMAYEKRNFGYSITYILLLSISSMINYICFRRWTRIYNVCRFLH